MKADLLAQTTLAILAGGEGSRMGRPKGLLDVHGRPILTYLLERLAWPGPKWVITSPGRERPPGSEAFDRELADPQAGVGPLRGVLTALESIQTPMLVVTPVDMPMLGGEQLAELVRALGARGNTLGVMFERVVEGLIDAEPFPLALRCEAASAVRERLQRGQRSVHRLLEDPSFLAVPAPGHWSANVWANLNEPAEYEAFLHKQAKG